MLARGNAAMAYEHGLKERIAIVEYPSLEKAIAANDSPAYQEALKALWSARQVKYRHNIGEQRAAL